jgi:hypothetical protein
MSAAHAPTTTDRGPARFELALMALLVLACSQASYAVHKKDGPFIGVADVLCGLLFLGWLYKVWREQRFRLLTLPTPEVWALLVVGALSLSRAMVDAEGGLSLGGLKSGVIELAQLGLYFVAAFCMFADVFNTLAKLRRACAVLLGATTAVVAWGLVDYLVAAKPMQVSASFGNRNVYSAFLVMVVPLLMGLAVHERNRMQRRWVAILSVAALVTMVGPPHVWILAALLLWITYNRGGRFRAIYAPLLLVAVLAVNVGLPRNRDANVVELFDPYERGELYKLEAGGQGTAPADSLIVKKRWLEWQPALMMISENLALGVGAGGYQRNIGESRYYGSLPNVKKSEPDTNNLYLVMGASMGLGALVCLVALLVRYWRRAGMLWLRAGSTTERGLAAGLPAAILGISAANLFSSLFVRGPGLIWAFVLAATAVAARESLAASRRRQAVADAAGPESAPPAQP